MKIRLLGGALTAILGAHAAAVTLNAEGIGQVLLYPYFTVNAGNQTLLTVVNTQNAGKAVKVHFREGYDGRNVLDFNLYLSPYDVWTATIFDAANINGRPDDGTAGAGLLTPDNSCTDPAIKNGTIGSEALPDGRRFVPFSSNAYATGAVPDGGPTDLSRTRTGHVELIEMADVTGATLQAITHINGVPHDCAAVIAAQPNADYVSPAGGLFGSASIVNVANGTLYGSNAEALNGFYTNSGNLFTIAGAALPDLSSGDNSNLSPGNAVSYVFADDGGLITSSWPLASGGSVDAVSSLFAANQLINEYEINPATGAVASEWVITFPTKRYYVDPALTMGIAPFDKVFGADPAALATACDSTDFRQQDREERSAFKSQEGGFQASLSPDVCWESQAISFQQNASVGETSPLFATPLFAHIDTLRNVGFSGTSGYVALILGGNGHTLRASNEGNVFSGLPTIGFLAKDFTNTNVTPGVLGNYAGVYRHRITHACSNAAGSCH